MKRYATRAAILLSLVLCQSVLGKALFQMNSLVETNRMVELTSTACLLPSGQKIRLAFSGQASGRLTHEADARIRLMDLRNVGNRVLVTFYNAQNEELKGSDVTVYILSQAFLPYVRVFYAPAQASTFRISLHPAAEATVAVKELSVGTDLDAGEQATLNPHPTFDYGDLNTYGCHSGYGGQFHTRPDGKTVWNTGFLGYTQFFPIQGDQFYSFFCRAKEYRGKKSYILIDCYTKGDTRPSKSMRLNMSDAGATTELKLPAGVVSVQLRCYCVILEEFRVTPSEKHQ